MLRHLLALPALLLIPATATAQDQPTGQDAPSSASAVEQRAQDILSAMRGEAAYDAVFTEAFQAAVAEAQFAAIVTQLEGQFGPIVGLEALEPASDRLAQIRIRFERGIASGSFRLDSQAPYYVSEFLLTGVEPVNDTAAALLSDLAALPGEASVLVTRIGGAQPVIAHNADAQLALGSTFKLYVLSALARAIDAGERNWDDVVPLTQRSYPSGQLQRWPAGAPVTLHTLATLMISISDNTATDELIMLLGREAIEAEAAASGHAAPDLLRPFMTTRELFVLKSGIEIDLAAHVASGAEQRLAVLESLADVEPAESDIIAAFSGDPIAIDIEWFASARDIARLFERLLALEDDTALGILAVNPSLAGNGRSRWQYAGYKGGSEPGVLNLSWLLQDESGAWSVVTLGWNNPDAALDQQQLEMLAMRALALAR